MSIQKVIGLGEKVEGSANYLFGYYDRWCENVLGTSVAGDNTLQTSSVPSGYIYQFKFLCFAHNDTTARDTKVILYTATGEFVVFISRTSLQQDLWKTFSTEVYLKEGDYIKAFFHGMSSGKGLHLHVWGCKMKIS